MPDQDISLARQLTNHLRSELVVDTLNEHPASAQQGSVATTA